MNNFKATRLIIQFENIQDIEQIYALYPGVKKHIIKELIYRWIEFKKADLNQQLNTNTLIDFLTNKH